MKRVISLVWVLLAGALNAAEEAPVPTVTPPPPPPPDYSFAPKEAEGLKAKWNVRIEAVMIGIPQEKYLALAPDLRDDEKVEGVLTQLLAAIARKEAVLMGWPIIRTLDGIRAQSETLDEKRYPVEFEPPAASQKVVATAPPPNPSPLVDHDMGVAMATAFETRNVGVTLEAEARVLSNGEWIDVSIVPQRVGLYGYDKFFGNTKQGQPITIEQPQFFTTKVHTELKVRNGERVLLAVHLLSKPEGHVELVFLRASATEVPAEEAVSSEAKKP